MRQSLLALLTLVVACTSQPEPSTSAKSQPKLEPQHTACESNGECTAWHATYSTEGCCPTACDATSPEAIAVNLEAYYMLDRHCYGKIVPRCDRSDAKFSCEDMPREARCSEGRCTLYDLEPLPPPP